MSAAEPQRYSIKAVSPAPVELEPTWTTSETASKSLATTLARPVQELTLTSVSPARPSRPTARLPELARAKQATTSLPKATAPSVVHSVALATGPTRTTVCLAERTPSSPRATLAPAKTGSSSTRMESAPLALRLASRATGF